MHKDFVYIDEVVNGICWDAKYATWDNFTGAPVDGYYANRIVGTRSMAEALLKVKNSAETFRYGLLIWDGYRPQSAVNCFLRWVEECNTDRTKERFYPNIDRKSMVQQGYIAAQSGHSRGSTVDLTMYRLDTRELLSMGGNFDLMDPRSNHDSDEITPLEAKNRKLLKSFMEEAGFKAYEFEWWHYTLINEPFPDTYFDFPIIAKDK